MKTILTIVLALLASCSGGASAHGHSSGRDGYAFEYRALCTPTNNNPAEFGITDINNVDYDWGLWGHNLYKILGDNPPDEVYALVGGKRDKSQYCFSSPALRSILTRWIADNWGDTDGRFTIMPADNKKVCQCSLCTAAGNTASNATPAVAALASTLAKQYPGHQFFLTAYHTTLTPPDHPLPQNVGVMLSTMDIPMRHSFRNSAGFARFNRLLEQWRQRTPILYVWEYSRNFDDYLTPYPCLLILQERLRYYSGAGVSGVFVNGSGHDYSTFDDMQTSVLARLLKDVDTDVDDAVRQFYSEHYPQCGPAIADYYLGLEHKVRSTDRTLPYYGTIGETIAAYLNPVEFTDFWVSLDKASKSVAGAERQYLNRMLTALAYTRLMLMPSPQDKEELLLVLADYKTVPSLTNYKETNGSLDDFIRKMGYKKSNGENR